jgi:hypothetical protein
LGLGFGAFLTSFLPLSLLPMGRSVPQVGGAAKGQMSAQITFSDGIDCSLGSGTGRGRCSKGYSLFCTY